MDNKKQVAVVKKENTTEIATLISQAITANVPVETMERLFSLRKEMKAEQAKEAFTEAMSIFQSECPVIEKTKCVNDKTGKLRYKFAPIDSIVEQIKKPLGKANLAYTFTVKNEPNLVTATCKITHILGHSEESSFQIPIDSDAYMSAPQKVASALTFAKRYTLCNALGISTGDEDTDATDVNKDKNAKSVKSKIMLALRELGEKEVSPAGVKASILKLTQLEPSEATFEEILGRLEILISDKNDDKENKI
jgi:hypothetical protein